MSGRKTYILANWKMHFSVKQSVALAQKFAEKHKGSVIVGVAPTALALSAVSEAVEDSSVAVIAQNAFYQDEGAFTGEVSMPMLRGVAKYVLVGHSERRHKFHETNEVVKLKLAAAVRSSIIPILCVGETLIEREHHQTNHVLNDQVSSGLANLTNKEVEKLVIAYEPVWAIGTGKFAHPDDAVKAVKKIRSEIAMLYGFDAANKVSILYGGSVNKENCGAYLQAEGIDGLLVGGASLSVGTFWPIVEKAESLLKSDSTKVPVEAED